MGNEYDLILDSKKKEISEEEYISMRGQYDAKLGELGKKTKKTILAFLCVYAVSFALLYVRLLFTNNAEYLGSCYILLGGLMLAVFLYDPKEEEDKKSTYEKDRTILLGFQKNKITAAKIRFGLVIGFGALFSVLNVVWWAVFAFVPPGETFESTLALFCTIGGM